MTEKSNEKGSAAAAALTVGSTAGEASSAAASSTESAPRSRRLAVVAGIIAVACALLIGVSAFALVGGWGSAVSDGSGGEISAVAQGGETADKTLLADEIAYAETLNEADYAEESWQVLAAALADARAVNDDASAAQERVDAAAAALTEAIDSLEKRAVDEDGSDSADSADGGSQNASAASDSQANVGSSGASSASQGQASQGSSQGGSEQPQTITVRVSVDSSQGSGAVSASTTLSFAVGSGATAYDALCGTGLSINASMGSMGVYVAAIGGLAEKDYGGQSGWKYSVNGVDPGMSCSAYVLSDGDVVAWRYVTSLNG